jgi:hypothetical protein
VRPAIVKASSGLFQVDHGSLDVLRVCLTCFTYFMHASYVCLSVDMDSEVASNCDQAKTFADKFFVSYMWLHWVTLLLSTVYLFTILKALTRGFRLYVPT